jgi:carbon storage regulator
MLALSRRQQETIVIGQGASQVVITVLGIYEGKVRLGIEAPIEIPVDRGEVRKRIEREGGR